MKINLIENFRALFYAPFYATFALGAFEAEGLDIEIKTPKEIGNSHRALAAGDAEVSWGGPMRLMAARDKDPFASGLAFCEVIGRDPFFLIGRSANPGFQMRDLLGKRVATVSEVPTPWICLQYDLKLAGIDPAAVTHAPAQTMAENVDALRKGEVDVIQVFQPYASTLIEEGAGHLWYSAAQRGQTCYTTLNTTRDFIQKRSDVVLRMTRAIYRVQKWITAHGASDLARVVASYLPDVPLPMLTRCCEGYRQTEVWSRNPVVQQAGLEWKREAMLSSRAIRERLDYDTYVDRRFADEVMRENPPSI
ncbi:MAG: ABC transporter substrate-binding protein [Burkholderiales bacterium]|nr:ABC transporter substrate-binding protein [Burkholderiales bacterium]